MARVIDFSFTDVEQISDELRCQQVSEGVEALEGFGDFIMRRSTGENAMAKLLAQTAAQLGLGDERSLIIEEIMRLRHGGFRDIADRYWELFQLAHGVTRGLYGLLYETKEWETPAQIRRQQAIKSVAAKLAKDPKQLAKAEAFKLWEDWQSGKTRYKSGAAYARYVVDVLPIESTKTVERWIKQWASEARKAD